MITLLFCYNFRNKKHIIMSKLIIVSNRLPVTIKKSKGKPELESRAGTFTSGLHAYYNIGKCEWVGWPGTGSMTLSASEKKSLYREIGEKCCHPVDITKNDNTNHNAGFCSKTIWPLFHYFLHYSRFEHKYWQAYKRVNRKYARKVMEVAKEGDKVWIHDYHLMLVPRILREEMPGLSIGFFLHIPFPSYELFRLLPWRKDILWGILGADLIGFHTFDYERHFMSCIRRLLGIDNILNTVKLGERTLKIDNFPMGIEYDYYQEQSEKLHGMSRTLKNLKKSFYRGQNDMKYLFSVDRLDYAKGLPERLNAYEQFLEDNPRYRNKVVFILFILPAHEILDEYRTLKQTVDETVGRINGKFGSAGWIPVRYFYRHVSREEMIEFYSFSDIAIVTPLRDGMNLIAKEFVACKTSRKGVLILSEHTGASMEMNEALIVNPYNTPEFSSTIRQALKMPQKEQKERLRLLQKRLSIYNVNKWTDHILESLDSIKGLQEKNYTKKISDKYIDNISAAFSKSTNRVFFLDYDGTLTGFFNNPEDAKPDSELYDIIAKLSEDPKNTVIIISGRDKETLQEWFTGFESLTLVAEHGVWFRDPGQEWEMMEQIDRSWMDIIRPTIEFYVDRTPRSTLEEKNYSLVWHYRDADPDLGIQRAWELKAELRDLISNLELEIMDGDKVIEIKNSGVDKGRAASRQLAKEDYDFIFAVGDDWTDEFTFGALPEEAFTIKVGTKSTKAAYYIDSVESVRKLLKKLGEVKQ